MMPFTMTASRVVTMDDRRSSLVLVRLFAFLLLLPEDTLL
jgi:hypothetical protein